jgi:hypothetical protein
MKRECMFLHILEPSLKLSLFEGYILLKLIRHSSTAENIRVLSLQTAVVGGFLSTIRVSEGRTNAGVWCATAALFRLAVYG